MIKNKSKAYWKENIRYLFILLIMWFFVSFGAGIIFKNFLNEFKLGGFKLGFNQKKEEESDVKKVKVGFKKRGKKKRKKR